MREIIKAISVFNKILSYKRVEYAYAKVHKSIFSNSNFQLNTLTSEEKKVYLNYWSGLGVKIKLETVVASKSLSGKFDKRIIPHEIYAGLVEPTFNKKEYAKFLEDKNFYNKWFGKDLFTNDFFHKIDGIYYDSNLEVISDIEIFIQNNQLKYPLVVKPSVDSYGGKNINFIENDKQLIDILPKFLNLVVQEKIIQHEFISSIYNRSINSVRVCLYRSPISGKVYFLTSTIRFGVDGSLDNLSSGGIACFIKEAGELDDYAVNIDGYKHFNHPDSGFVFKGQNIPFYDKLVERSIEIAKKAPRLGVLSLDMCLNNKNKWICLETNLLGQSISLPQHAGVPFFKEHTREVIEILKKNKR